MQANLYSYYLNSMEITQWELRGHHIEDSIYCYRLQLNRSRPIQGLLLAEENGLTEQDRANEEKLLQAICTALLASWQGERLAVRACQDLVKQSEQKYDFLIVLAKNNVIANTSLDSMNFKLRLHSYSLSQLLLKPELKAQTWRTLQPIFTL